MNIYVMLGYVAFIIVLLSIFADKTNILILGCTLFILIGLCVIVDRLDKLKAEQTEARR